MDEIYVNQAVEASISAGRMKQFDFEDYRKPIYEQVGQLQPSQSTAKSSDSGKQRTSQVPKCFNNFKAF